MYFIFKGGEEFVAMSIERENKKLKLLSSRTNHILTDMPWKMLFDKGKEAEQEELTDKMDDKNFRIAIVAAMAEKGYQLRKVEL